MQTDVSNYRIALSLALTLPPDSLVHIGIRREPGFFQLWHALDVSNAIFIDASEMEVQWAKEQISNFPGWRAVRTSTVNLTTLDALFPARSRTIDIPLAWLVVDSAPSLPVLLQVGTSLDQWSVIRCESTIENAATDTRESELSKVTVHLHERGYRQAMVTESDSPLRKKAWFVRDWRTLALRQIAANAASLRNSTTNERPVTVKRAPDRKPDVAAENISSPEIQALRSEVELMRHELSVAQRTGYLGARAADAGAAQLKSFSQLGQDLWVLNLLGAKRNGFFVDIGASDGVLLNNTYLLEKQYGWSGICIEANQADCLALKQSRSCTVSDACVWSVTGDEKEFILAKEYGGLAAVADDDMHAAKRHAYRELGEVVRVRTTSLNDLLAEYKAPAEIDYISLDVEGAEFDILSTFDFARWNVNLWTIEHNFSLQRARIRALMTEHGYSFEESQWDDWYFRSALRNDAPASKDVITLEST